jgi:MYXO-CTERM domain-containing protein
VASAADCDDTDAGVNPAATEVCDGVDNDCDGEIDPPDAEGALTLYADADLDGYGADGAAGITGCSEEPGLAATGGDCDDADPLVHPDAEELCQGLDDDCDGDVDEGCPEVPGLTPEDESASEGCGCDQTGGPSGAMVLPLLALAIGRRRRT